MAKSQSVKRPALFLDRDGVINIDHGYVYKLEDFEFVDGIFELVKRANDAGYLVIIITNQAGIGRGYYTEDDFHNLMNWVLEQFKLRGAHVDAVYFCPHHNEFGVGGYKVDCNCRKPKSGMFELACEHHAIDCAKSIMVGDKISDLQAAAGVGVKKCYFYGQSLDVDLFRHLVNFSDVSL